MKSVIQNYGPSQQSFPFSVVVDTDADGKEEREQRIITIPAALRGTPGTSRPMDSEEIEALKEDKKNLVFKKLLEQGEKDGLKIVPLRKPQAPQAAEPSSESDSMSDAKVAELVESITDQVMQKITPKLEGFLEQFNELVEASKAQAELATSAAKQAGKSASEAKKAAKAH